MVVDGNRIEAIGPAGAVTDSRRRTRIDVAGKTIIPGIIDVHAHVGGETTASSPQTELVLLANLAFGVTTPHDPSNDTDSVFTNSELAARRAR